jgi:integral membrane protein
MTPAQRQLWWTGRLEGISFLVLLGIAMPLKHAFGMPMAVRVVGLAHGVLFLMYVMALLRIGGEERWPRRRTALGFLASLVPFGPFWFERRWRPPPEHGKLRDP